MDQDAALADEISAIAFDFEVKDVLSLFLVDLGDFDAAGKVSQGVAGFEVAGDRPAFSGEPEAVKRSGVDLFAVGKDQPQGFDFGRARVGDNGVIAERAGLDVAEDSIADANRFDRFRPSFV